MVSPFLLARIRMLDIFIHPFFAGSSGSKSHLHVHSARVGAEMASMLPADLPNILWESLGISGTWVAPNLDHGFKQGSGAALLQIIDAGAHKCML